MTIWQYKGSDTKKLQLEITSFCNLACPGCERTCSKAVLPILNTKIMELKDIKKWFTPLTVPKLNEISFSGQIDEPCIHPHVDEIVEYFLENWPKASLCISTNGSTRNEKLFTKLGELSKQYNNRLDIEFALDGLEDTNHIYRVGSDYHKVIRHAKAYINAGGKASWKMILFEHNKHQVEEAKLIAKEMSFHRFSTIISARKSTRNINYKPDKIPLKYTEIKRAATTQVAKEEIVCRSLTKKGWLFVNYDGVANPCCYFGYTERSKDPLDNLHNISVEDYFDTSPFLDNLRSSWLTENPNPTCNKKCSKTGSRDDAIIYLENGKEECYTSSER
jgi:MoaA/NifB/PqqE/SkfB family radical SAM enzyme|tara:strand:- start:3632 stop:4630 length:999 start_codon:yes stop_codon:yes gene_type:complete